ncbi:MAG: UbiD family decarboxylase [Hyphomicrobiales bacterium]|nr:UbiD family decarboxylase [Hyphomicrobiales bacterium]
MIFKRCSSAGQRTKSASTLCLNCADMTAATRAILNRRIAPVRVPRQDAPVNEVVLRGDQIDLTRFPIPKFWPADGGPFIGTGTVIFTRAPSGAPLPPACRGGKQAKLGGENAARER